MSEKKHRISKYILYHERMVFSRQLWKHIMEVFHTAVEIHPENIIFNNQLYKYVLMNILFSRKSS